MQRSQSRIAHRASCILHCALCTVVVAAANAATTIFEAPVDPDAPPRTEVVVTNLPAMWPRGADRLFVEVWSLDDGEEPVVFSMIGGRGEDGKLKGVHSVVEELPPGGNMRCIFGKGKLKHKLDLNALSNVTVRIESGKPQRFGVSRLVFLKKGEDAPTVADVPRRHPRDAAEHAEDFTKFKAECANGGFVIGWATSMENVRPRGGFKWRKADKVGVCLARGEYESVQILVAPNGKELKGVQVALEGDLTPVQSSELGVVSYGGFAATNVAACIVGYSETIHPPPYVVRPPKGGKMKRPPCGWYPDPILDFQKSCDISGTDVQSFWIRVRCPRDQKAGVYDGALVVSAAGGGSVRIPFSVRVNDFEVGRVSPLPLAISVAPGDKDPDSWRNDWKKHPDEFCDFFADYFITPDQLYCNGAREPHWDMLKRLKDQGRLNMFNLRYMWYMGLGEKGEVAFREKILPVLKARYEKAKELGIEKHAYFYGFDELGANTFSNCFLTVEQLHKGFPGVPVMTTARDKLLGADGSRLPNIDMHCPATCFWNPVQAEKARRAGRQVWWYFCNNPASPFANMTLEGPPCEIRSLMGAQTQKFKPDGFLYYATTHWYAKDPIKKGPFTKWEPRSFGAYHGDGQWTCCGGPDNMPLPTIRLENFRDGVEDLWYVKLLEQKLREVESSFAKATEDKSSENWIRRAKAALAVPNEVARSVASFSTDPDVIYGWRNAMADLIDEAAAKMADVEKIALEGDYAGHLQDVWWDGGTNLWWAHTHQIVRTDMEGRILAKVDVEGHNAGIEVRDGRLYVAVCLMQNKTAGKTTPECHPQINVHDAVTLQLLERHVLEDVIDRTGSLAILPDGSFVVGCLRPQDITKSQVRLHHIDRNYKLIRSVVLDNVEVELGIETIKYKAGELFLSMYKGKGLLVVLDAATFAEKRRQEYDGTTGLVFDGTSAWCGRTRRNEATGRFESSLIRLAPPNGVE